MVVDTENRMTRMFLIMNHQEILWKQHQVNNCNHEMVFMDKQRHTGFSANVLDEVV